MHPVFISETGDIAIGAGGKYTMFVQSSVLCDLSPVFKKMLGGDFKEGLKHDFNTERPHPLNLNEDHDGDGVLHMVALLHNRHEMLARPLPARDLLQLAVSVDQYKVQKALTPHLQVYINEADLNDLDSFKLFLGTSIRLEDEKFFRRICTAWVEGMDRVRFKHVKYPDLTSCTDLDLDKAASDVLAKLGSQLSRSVASIARVFTEILKQLGRNMSSFAQHEVSGSKCLCGHNKASEIIRTLADLNMIPGDNEKDPFPRMDYETVCDQVTRFGFAKIPENKACSELARGVLQSAIDKVEPLKKELESKGPWVCFMCTCRGNSDAKCPECQGQSGSTDNVD